MRQRSRRASRLLAVPAGVLVTAVAAAVVTVVTPGAAGLSGRWPWIVLISFRLATGVALAVGGLVALVLAVRARRHRAARGFCAVLAAVGLMGAAVQAGVLADRGLHPHLPAGPAAADQITVAVTNTDFSQADSAALARLFLATHADVMAMPETDPRLADAVARRLAAGGVAVQVFGVPAQPGVIATSLLISSRLGRYRQVGGSGQGIGEVLADPVGGVGGRPVLVAVHPVAPQNSAFVSAWAAGTAQAVAVCRAGSDTVEGGDFNSNLDHPALRALGPCVDAARAAGAAGIGTWPSRVPDWLGTPLDHVLVTGSVWRPVEAGIAPIPGSDHRALVTRLTAVAAGVDVGTWRRG